MVKVREQFLSKFQCLLPRPSWTPYAKEGRMEGGERGGRERKEGTEELGSFDLWGLWLPFSPESQRKHSGNLPRAVFIPVPPLTAPASATSPQEATGASAGPSRGTPVSSDPAHWPRAGSGAEARSPPLPPRLEAPSLVARPVLDATLLPRDPLQNDHGSQQQQHIEPLQSISCICFQRKDKKVYHIRKCDQKLWFSLAGYSFSHTIVTRKINF